MDMSLDDDLQRITLQEQRLQFDRFDPTVALELGLLLKEIAEARGAAVTIDISLHGQQLFHFAMAGTSPNNADWIRRKRNVVARYYRSSYAIGLQMAQRQTTLQAAVGLDLKDYADHGGSFPLVVKGAGCIGAVTVSGLPQREDHALVVDALGAFLGCSIDDISLSR
jgi:uncharacterized protein (UPF0303 family)